MTVLFLFGKLPAHGDFVARGLAAPAREAIDLWLSAEMAAARVRLGEDFEESFDQAPPWRFVWAGEDGWAAGALAASVDGVGRRFPILLGRGGLGCGEAAAMAERAEHCIYDAFGEGLDADGLIERLTAADVATGAEPGAEGWWTLGSGSFPEAHLPGRMPEGLLTTALTRIEEAA